MGAALKVGQHLLDLLVEAASAGDQRQRIEIALKRQPFRQSGNGGFRVSGGVEADRVDFGKRPEFGDLRPRAARKGDQPRVRRLGANLGRDRRDRREAPAVEFGRRQHARPGIEDLRRIGAGCELTTKVFGRTRRQAGRSGARTDRDADRRKAAPAPGPACRGPRSCSSPPSTARRRSRSTLFPSAGPPSGGRELRTPAQVGPSRARLLSFASPSASPIGSRRGPSPLSNETA